MAARSKTWSYNLSIVGIAGSSPTRVLMDLKSMSLQQTDHSSIEVLPSVIDEPHTRGLGPLGLSSHELKMYLAGLTS